jgi:hypothetical protein
MNRTTLSLTLLLCSALSAPALGQTIYKCPSPDGTVTLQQMPCSPQGGGETLQLNVPKPGRDGGLRESEKAYMHESSDRIAQQAEADAKEKNRQEAMDIERDKAKAADNQARATWYLGSAMLMSGRR